MAEAHLAFGDINAMSMYSETSAAKASSSPRFRPHCRGRDCKTSIKCYTYKVLVLNVLHRGVCNQKKKKKKKKKPSKLYTCKQFL